MSLPTQRIQIEEDVALWRHSSGYNDFVGWIVKRAERIAGKEMITGPAAHLHCSEPIRLLLEMLDKIESWTSEAPPLPDSQRFGNKAFRTYHSLIEERLPTLLPTPPNLAPSLLPLLLASHAFGHPTRLDYGSGHELSFVLFLFVLIRRGWIVGEEAEDDCVLRVFPRYLELTTMLQKRYNLEPAGSHGVWGLDDFVFLPYLWGSAQLLGTNTSPAQALGNAKSPTYIPTDLWTISLRRVFEFKTGPFYEHSPLLHSLSTTFPDYIKPHRGLVKMYLEEVLGKRVVVQHLFLDDTTFGPLPPPSTHSLPSRTMAPPVQLPLGTWPSTNGPQRGTLAGLPKWEASRPMGKEEAPWAIPGGGAGGGEVGTKAPWAR